MSKIYSYLLILLIATFAACDYEVIPNEKSLSGEPTACIGSLPAQCQMPCIINYNASCSENATMYSWNFGDGNTSDLQQGSHTYLTPGTYTATLEVSNNSGTTSTNAISIQVVENSSTPIADFSFDDSITYYENCTAVQFINNSQNATSYLWEFGDGNTSTDENPNYTYEKAGNYIVTLSINGNDIFIAKELSVSEVRGTENNRSLSEADGYYDIVRAQEDKFLITGYTNLFETRDAHLAVIDFDANLTNSWTLEADRSNQGFAVAISNNNYFIAVRTFPIFSNPFNTNIVKLSSDGTVLWDIPFQAPDNSNIDALDIIPGDDGDVILTGSVEQGEVEKVFIMKVLSSGVQSDFDIYEGEKGYSVVKTSNGDVAVAGVSVGSNYLSAAYFLLIDKNGNIKEEKTFQYRNYETQVRELKQTNDGFIITGFVHRDEVEYDIYMAKINTDGNVEWQHNYPESGDQYGTSVVATTDGRYVVVGQSGYLLITDGLGELLSPMKKITNGRMFSILSDDCHFMIAGRNLNDDFLIIKTDSEGKIN